MERWDRTSAAFAVVTSSSFICPRFTHPYLSSSLSSLIIHRPTVTNRTRLPPINPSAAHPDYDSISGSDPEAFSEDDLDEADASSTQDQTTPTASTSTLTAKPDRRHHLMSWPNMMPYEVETLDEMDRRLDLIVTRLSEAVEAKAWSIAFYSWHRELSRWLAYKVRNDHHYNGLSAWGTARRACVMTLNYSSSFLL